MNRRAAGALLALAACVACATAAPATSNQTSLDLYDGASEGCYYNFQSYNEGDRIMTNEPCLNCTCHNRMLMCYLRVCPFTKPIGHDCTVEKRADQCCPIVTCPDVPVDLLTSTSTSSSAAEYGATGLGKVDKYGCDLDGKYYPEGAKVPPSPNKPCEHCYCIRNMTTCVMQECTLHVDGCTPIYHKEVCCPVRYSCDHAEDEVPLLDDMTTTVRPTPGFLLTTTAISPVTQISQDCVHEDKVYPDGTLIKTEKACENCYCMKGDIVCLVQECGNPMENEGKNCTSMPPREGQCCPDTYICEGDELSTEVPTVTDQTTLLPPRRAGVEGSGYRNEDETSTESISLELEMEGSGAEPTTISVLDENIPQKTTVGFNEDIATTSEDEIIPYKPSSPSPPETTDENKTPKESTTEPDMGLNTVPIEETHEESSTPYSSINTNVSEAKVTTTPVDIDRNVDIPETTLLEKATTEKSMTTESSSEYDKIQTEQPFTTTFVTEKQQTSTESFKQPSKEDHVPQTEGPIISPEPEEKDDTTSENPIDEVTLPAKIDSVDKSSVQTSTSADVSSTTTERTEADLNTELTQVNKEITNEPMYTTESTSKILEKETEPSTLYVPEVTHFYETTTLINEGENKIDDEASRIPGEGQCLQNLISYKNNSIVPSLDKCSICKCVSSLVKCDPIICSPPPEYMNNCERVYDTPESCCPTYKCQSSQETAPPQPHSQMSGTESPLPTAAVECNGDDCGMVDSKPDMACTSGDCSVQSSQAPQSEVCGPDGCKESKPKEGCEGNQCGFPVSTCTGTECPTGPKPERDDCGPNGCRDMASTQTTETPENICVGTNCPSVVSACTGNDCQSDMKPDITECGPEGCDNIIPTKSPLPEPTCTGEDCQSHIKPVSNDCGPNCDIDIQDQTTKECSGTQCTQQKPQCLGADCQVSECGSEGCDNDKQSPDQPQSECVGSQCLLPVPVCTGNDCQSTVKPENTDCGPTGCDEAVPSISTKKPQEQCSGSQCALPVPDCTDGDCTSSSQLECEDPDKCVSKTPESGQSCEGDSCSHYPNVPSSDEKVECNETNGCQQPVATSVPVECVGETCRKTEVSNVDAMKPIECDQGDCSPTKQNVSTTESPAIVKDTQRPSPENVDNIIEPSISENDIPKATQMAEETTKLSETSSTDGFTESFTESTLIEEQVTEKIETKQPETFTTPAIEIEKTTQLSEAEKQQTKIPEDNIPVNIVPQTEEASTYRPTTLDKTETDLPEEKVTEKVETIQPETSTTPALQIEKTTQLSEVDKQQTKIPEENIPVNIVPETDEALTYRPTTSDKTETELPEEKVTEKIETKQPETFTTPALEIDKTTQLPEADKEQTKIPEENITVNIVPQTEEASTYRPATSDKTETEIPEEKVTERVEPQQPETFTTPALEIEKTTQLSEADEQQTKIPEENIPVNIVPQTEEASTYRPTTLDKTKTEIPEEKVTEKIETKQPETSTTPALEIEKTTQLSETDKQQTKVPEENIPMNIVPQTEETSTYRPTTLDKTKTELPDEMVTEKIETKQPETSTTPALEIEKTTQFSEIDKQQTKVPEENIPVNIVPQTEEASTYRPTTSEKTETELPERRKDSADKTHDVTEVPSEETVTESFEDKEVSPVTETQTQSSEENNKPISETTTEHLNGEKEVTTILPETVAEDSGSKKGVTEPVGDVVMHDIGSEISTTTEVSGIHSEMTSKTTDTEPIAYTTDRESYATIPDKFTELSSQATTESSALHTTPDLTDLLSKFGDGAPSSSEPSDSELTTLMPEATEKEINLPTSSDVPKISTLSDTQDTTPPSVSAPRVTSQENEYLSTFSTKSPVDQSFTTKISISDDKQHTTESNLAEKDAVTENERGTTESSLQTEAFTNKPEVSQSVTIQGTASSTEPSGTEPSEKDVTRVSQEVTVEEQSQETTKISYRIDEYTSTPANSVTEFIPHVTEIHDRPVISDQKKQDTSKPDANEITTSEVPYKEMPQLYEATVPASTVSSEISTQHSIPVENDGQTAITGYPTKEDQKPDDGVKLEDTSSKTVTTQVPEFMTERVQTTSSELPSKEADTTISPLFESERTPEPSEVSSAKPEIDEIPQNKPPLTTSTQGPDQTEETTPYIVELEEHPHRPVDESTTNAAIDEFSVTSSKLPLTTDASPTEMPQENIPASSETPEIYKPGVTEEKPASVEYTTIISRITENTDVGDEKLTTIPYEKELVTINKEHAPSTTESQKETELPFSVTPQDMESTKFATKPEEFRPTEESFSELPNLEMVTANPTVNLGTETSPVQPVEHSPEQPVEPETENPVQLSTNFPILQSTEQPGELTEYPVKVSPEQTSEPALAQTTQVITEQPTELSSELSSNITPEHKIESTQTTETPSQPEVPEEPIKATSKQPDLESLTKPIPQVPSESNSEQPHEPASEQPSEEITEQPLGLTSEQSSELITEQPIVSTPEQPSPEQTSEKQPAETIPEQTTEPVPEQEITDKPSDKTPEKPSELIPEQSSESIPEQSSEPITEQPRDKMSEKPIEPITELPSKPIPEQPSEPTELPSKEISENPSTPISELPNEPITEQSSQPITEQPSEPIPEQPSPEQTSESVPQEPSVPTSEYPSEKTTEEPREPLPEQPSESTSEQPSVTIPEQPSEPVTELPSEPIPEQPSESITELPSELVPEQPSKPSPGQPSEPIPEQPSESVTEHPSEPITEQPSESIPEQPSEPVTEQPSATVPKQPSEFIPEQPSEHIPEQSSESIPEEPSEPMPEQPSAPSPEQHSETVPPPEEQFPPSGGYAPEPDYGDEDQAFGPGTCRYGGKVYVSAQQIPRDDPCDFCFCFRSDIICLQQSCPPPIHGCHEEPIEGFCCPRYECPVSMATALNVTTTTTTTTTTLPPHFLPHAYKGAAQKTGCQVKGHTYKVGEVVRASSGPCLHCTCGGDGQMKCDPKACTPEPMLRQMIAAAVSSKRRR